MRQLESIIIAGNTAYIYGVAFLLLIVFGSNSAMVEAVGRVLFAVPQLPFFFLAALAVLVLILTVIFVVKSLHIRYRKEDAKDLAVRYRTMKLIQIPAYLIIFLAGMVCLLTIFTFAVSVILLLLDVIGVFLSGCFALGVMAKLKEAGYITGKERVLFSVLSFVFCIDVLVSILAVRKTGS